MKPLFSSLLLKQSAPAAACAASALSTPSPAAPPAAWREVSIVLQSSVGMGGNDFIGITAEPGVCPYMESSQHLLELMRYGAADQNINTEIREKSCAVSDIRLRDIQDCPRNLTAIGAFNNKQTTCCVH